MNDLEQQTFTDGFRVALLGAERDPAGSGWRYGWRLFDGGRIIDRGQVAPNTAAAPDVDFAPLLRLVLRVVAPPHILVGFGRGWRELLTQTLDRARAAELRVLDLTAVAHELENGAGGVRTLDALIQAYGIRGAHLEEALVDDRHEALLWSVLARAGARGLGWPDLLRLPERRSAAVSFEGYAFDAETIAALPNRPGVYVMHDRDAQVLYVGKSGDLCRRLGEYFRPTGVLPEKIAAIRRRIHRFTVEEVGSELEALLLEHDRIETLMPELNIQRRVAEERGRYGTPTWPKLVVLPSVADTAPLPAPDTEEPVVPLPAKSVELFGFGDTQAAHAFQVRVALARPPRATLAALCARLNGTAPALRRTRAIRDWGTHGNAICSRFFGAHADRLHWCEIPPGHPDDAYLNTLLRVIHRAAQTGFDPAEVRF